MHKPPQRLLTKDGSLDLALLARRVKAGQWMIWLTVAIALFAAIVYLKSATYRYTVSYEVTPVQGSSDSLTSTLGRVGGIAAMAGISIPQGSDTSFKLYLEALQSRDVANELAKNKPLMRKIFFREWNPETSTWKEPDGLVYNLSTGFRRFLNVPGTEWHQPDGARLQQFLSNEVVVFQDIKSVTASASLKVASPELGREILTELHDETDGMLRRRAIMRTDGYIMYLTNKLRTVLLAEHRAALSQALGEQERQRMMASSPRSYAAEIFQYPVASAMPTSPRPLLVILVALIGGFVVGLSLCVLRIMIAAFVVEGSTTAMIEDSANQAQRNTDRELV